MPDKATTYRPEKCRNEDGHYFQIEFYWINLLKRKKRGNVVQSLIFVASNFFG